MGDKNTKVLSFFLAIVTFLTISMLWSCAQTKGVLTGGPRDKTPPVLDTSQSTPNYATNFSQKKIELYFDEFITTRSLVTKTLISPPLVYIPKMESRGKKLTIELNKKEVLKDNATYIFNFGDAVADFREGNKIEDFSFVFATGDVIDSLFFQGDVYDAKTGKGIKDVYVMLYDNFQDSVVYQEKPFYFAITDKDGKFKFQNLRSDTFKLFALQDANLNYIYDQPSEMIGFLDSLIYLTDSSAASYSLEMFQEGSAVRLIKLASAKNGIAKLVYSDRLENEPEYQIVGDLGILYKEINKDTFSLYFPPKTDSFTIYISGDTLNVKPSLDTSLSGGTIALIKSGRSNNKILSPIDSLVLAFPSLLAEVNSDMIAIQDSNENSILTSWTISNKSVKGIGAWKQDSAYDVTLYPGAVTDIFGRRNDTTVFKLQVNNKEKYGDVIFALDSISDQFTYKVDLTQGGNPFKTIFVSGTDSASITFTTLSPGEYGISVLEDRNNNGRWDPGSYQNKTYSEKIKTIKLDKLRENWELNAKIVWK